MGQPNVEAMLAGMSGSQFEKWVAYYAVEPFGEHRAELRNGTLISTLVNVLLPGARSRFKPLDFMHYREEDAAPALTRAEVAKQVRQVFQGMMRAGKRGDQKPKPGKPKPKKKR